MFKETSNKSQIEGFTFLFVFNEVTCSTYEIKLVDEMFEILFCYLSYRNGYLIKTKIFFNLVRNFNPKH